MARPETKNDLLRAAAEGWETMNTWIASLTEQELSAPFDFSKDEKKKEAHWGRDKNLRDVLTHLYEWHRLLLEWVRANRNGEKKSFLPEPYTWRTYGEMNAAFWSRHQNTSLEEAKAMLTKSHQDVIALAETFSDEELFTKGAFPWVGTSTLGSYFTSSTSSHYNWAVKKLKAHRKNCQAK